MSDATDQRFRWRRVQALDHEHPFRCGVTRDGPLQMTHNIRCSPAGPHGRRQDLPGRDLKMGDQRRRARPKIFTLHAFHHACLQRTCGRRAFMSLKAGLLIGAHELHPLLVSWGCLVIQLADGPDVWGKGRWVFGARVIEPIP